jgi:peptide/nickel transport system ATP-binding protein
MSVVQKRADEAAKPNDIALLAVRGLSVVFASEAGHVTAVEQVDLDLERGSALSIVGESGSGKSSLALALARLLPDAPRCTATGSMRFDGRELASMPEQEMCALRGRDIGFVFQEPMTALDPLMRVGEQIAEPLVVHSICDRRTARSRAEEMLARVGLDDPKRAARAFPHELSGGMRQRALIAMAVACRPKLLVLDEPTTALDTVNQELVMSLVRELRRELALTVVLVTHDIELARANSDQIAVMYAGRIVEAGPTADVLARPAHPYTQGLVRCSPARTPRGTPLAVIPGAAPDPRARPSGCAFRTRCDRARDECARSVPRLDAFENTAGLSARHVACYFPGAEATP